MKDTEVKTNSIPMLDIQTPKNLNVCCKEIHLTQNSLDIKIYDDMLKNFDSITINGVKFVKEK